jgi:hypothetical protein
VAQQEGAGHAVLSAYVEIVFDNSDNRIPVRKRKTGMSLPSTLLIPHWNLLMRKLFFEGLVELDQFCGASKSGIFTSCM